MWASYSIMSPKASYIFHFARLPFFSLGEYIIRNFCFVYTKLIYTFFKRFERLFVSLVAVLFV